MSDKPTIFRCRGCWALYGLAVVGETLPDPWPCKCGGLIEPFDGIDFRRWFTATRRDADADL